MISLPEEENKTIRLANEPKIVLLSWFVYQLYQLCHVCVADSVRVTL